MTCKPRPLIAGSGLALAFSLALAAATLTLARPAHAEGPPARPAPSPAGGAGPRTLRVTGEGRASAVPDTAVVTFGVTAVNGSLAAATREATDRARRLSDVLRTVVAPADLQTARYDVQIEYAQSSRPSDAPPRITGYRVSNDLGARVRDLSKLGGLLDRAVAAGANEIRGLAFLKDDTSPEQARALVAAVKAARAKAEEMARAAGVRLGELVDLSEGARGPGPVPVGRMMAMSVANEVPVEAGQVEVAAHVEAIFAVH